MIKTKLSLEVRDFEGNLLQKKEQEGRSWVIGLMAFLYMYMSKSNALVVKDVTNTNRTLYFPTFSGGQYVYCTSNLQVAASGGGTSTLVATGRSGNQTYPAALDSTLVGIAVGTGAGAATPTDYVLATPVIHGLAAGQILYGGCGVDSLTFANPNGSFIIRRDFINVSGGNITLNEVGIYSPGQTGDNLPDNTNPNSFMIYRDIIGGGLAIVNGNVISAAVTVSVVV